MAAAGSRNLALSHSVLIPPPPHTHTSIPRQDSWGCERSPENVSVLILESDEMRATLTPQYGGKVWALYDKVNKREMVYNNRGTPYPPVFSYFHLQRTLLDAFP